MSWFLAFYLFIRWRGKPMAWVTAKINPDFIVWRVFRIRLHACFTMQCYSISIMLYIQVIQHKYMRSNKHWPGRRQAIIWTSAGILLIGSLGTNFSEILIGIQTFSFRKMQLKMSSAKWRPFCLGLNVLTWINFDSHRIINSICWL